MPTTPNMPTFLVIGAAKSGTSSLYVYFTQHPQIYMSPYKEPRFFAFEGEKLDFRGPPGTKLEINEATVTDLQSYQRLFAAAPPGAQRGEASVHYLSEQKAPHRIKRYVPDIKLIAILRDPVERAYSSYLHVRRENREPEADFSRALDLEATRIEQNWPLLYRYVDGGRYTDQLKRYFELFDQSQIRIYLFEDLRAKPLTMVQDCFDFLGVDPTYVPDVHTPYNASGVPRSATLDTVLRGPDSMRRLRRKLRPFLAGGWLHSAYAKLKARNFDKPTMPEEARERLRETFQPEILRLQDLIGRDLSAWLTR